VAVRFNAASEKLTRTTGLWDYNSAYSWMAWFYPISTTNFEEYLLIEQAAGSNNIDALQRQGTSSQLNLVVWIAGVATQLQGGSITSNQWTHLAVVRESATVLKAYQDGQLIITVTSPSVTGRQPAGLMGFGDVHGGIGFNGRVAVAKAWGAFALDQAMVQAEMHTVLPHHRIADQWGYWPMLPGSERANDLSGRGRHWTEGGALSDEEGPGAVSWGAPVLESPVVAVGAPPQGYTVPPLTITTAVVAPAVRLGRTIVLPTVTVPLLVPPLVTVKGGITRPLGPVPLPVEVVGLTVQTGVPVAPRRRTLLGVGS
jgi:Concanavalin A-like lectin/glucanases superfamily